MNRRHIDSGDCNHHARQQHPLLQAVEFRHHCAKRKRDCRGVSHPQVDRREYHDRGGGNHRSDQGAHTAQQRIEPDAPEVQHRAEPHRADHHAIDEPAVFRQLRFPDIRQCGRHEGQHGCKPRQAVQPLHEHGHESPPRAECLTYPQIDAAVLRPCRSQFRRHQRGRHEETQRGGGDVKNDTVAVFGLFREIHDRQYGGDIQHRQRENPHRRFFSRSGGHNNPPVVTMTLLWLK